jgi:lipoprotein signal peptidase
VAATDGTTANQAASGVSPEGAPRPASAIPPDSAFFAIAAHLRLWVVAGICLVLDLASKNWAFHSLAVGEERVLIPGVVKAMRSLNAGALFGAFAGWVIAFIIASLLALGFVLYVFACSRRKQAILHLALSFILAGALGNLHDRTFVKADVVQVKMNSEVVRMIGVIKSKPGADRLILTTYPDELNPQFIDRSDVVEERNHGVVRDFLKFIPLAGFDYWPWVFNVADSLLVVGVCLLLIIFTREHRMARQERLALESST